MIMWAGLALLLVLCLPFARIQKLVLEIITWALRLALLALLGAAAYLWFHPEDLPVEVTNTLANVPPLQNILPEPGTQAFGVCAASLLVIVFLPVLALLDVGRQLASWRLRGRRDLAAEPEVVPPPHTPEQRPVLLARRVDRRAAANTLAEAAPRKRFRASNPLEA
jgi:hypothetical protein